MNYDRVEVRDTSEMGKGTRSAHIRDRSSKTCSRSFCAKYWLQEGRSLGPLYWQMGDRIDPPHTEQVRIICSSLSPISPPHSLFIRSTEYDDTVTQRTPTARPTTKDTSAGKIREWNIEAIEGEYIGAVVLAEIAYEVGRRKIRK